MVNASELSRELPHVTQSPGPRAGAAPQCLAKGHRSSRRSSHVVSEAISHVHIKRGTPPCASRRSLRRYPPSAATLRARRSHGRNNIRIRHPFGGARGAVDKALRFGRQCRRIPERSLSDSEDAFSERGGDKNVLANVRGSTHSSRDCTPSCATYVRPTSRPLSSAKPICAHPAVGRRPPSPFLSRTGTERRSTPMQSLLSAISTPAFAP